MNEIFRKAGARSNCVNGVTAGLFKRHNIDIWWWRQNTFSGFNLPVAGINNPHRGGDRAFHTRHQINPLPYARILFEVARIDHIHAAGVRDVIIDRDHLAMLAQVHTA